MRTAVARSLWLVGCLAVLSVAAAQERPPGAPAGAQPGVPGPAPRRFVRSPEPAVLPKLPTVPLQTVLDRVARESHKQFLVDGHVSPEIFLGGVGAEDVTYPLLLSILRANGLAAVDLDGRTSIVPEGEVRWYATPLVQKDDKSIPADEWVTRVLTVSNVSSAFLVPILRPLLPQAAHLAAFPPRHLVVMDRYANVQRITAIVRLLDQPGAGVPPDTRR